MAKTITLKDSAITSIVINRVTEKIDGKYTNTGYQCNLHYAINDSDGNEINNKQSTKYTSGTSFADKLSSDSETLVNNFINSMQTNMDAKEEL